jgi:hypothetical protein
MEDEGVGLRECGDGHDSAPISVIPEIAVISKASSRGG